VRLFDILVILSIIDPHLRSHQIGFLPRLYQAATGNPGPLRSLITGFYGGPPVSPQIYSSGLHAATLCADLTDMPWGTAATPLRDRQAALDRAIKQIPAAATWPFPTSTAAGQGIMQECRYWPPARPDPRAPYRTLTMPVLLLAGALDLSTPLPWAQQEAAQIPHAQLVVIPAPATPPSWPRPAARRRRSSSCSPDHRVRRSACGCRTGGVRPGHRGQAGRIDAPAGRAAGDVRLRDPLPR